MAEVTPPFPVQVSNYYNSWDYGAPYKDLVSEGVVGSGDLLVGPRGAGANNSVDIAAGTGWVAGDDNAGQQPTYRVYNNATKNLTLTQDATNPRIALIVAHVYDAHFSGATYTWILEAVLGTPAASPVAPALPNNCLLLATVTVPASPGTVGAGQITDNRVSAALGGNARAAVITDKLYFGTARDTTLYRLAAGVLATDGRLDIGNAGALIKGTSASAFQTTIGANGAAAALTALPAKYMKVMDNGGTIYVIPLYNS